MKITTILFFMNVFSGMGYSILSPLFPSLGTKEGLTEALIGWIISIFAMSNTLITPFTPFLCKKFTRIKLLYFSTFCEASCTILYGFLGLISSYYPLILSMFIIRIIHGCCCGIIGTLVYSLTISLSKKEETKVALGNLEIGWCLGTSCGPIFASVFYKIGGYPLPFIVLGLFLYTSVYLSIQVSHEKTESEEEMEGNPPILKFLLYSDINFILGSLILGIAAQTFYFPCLTNHLKAYFNLSVSISSLFFIIIAVAYLISLQFLDAIAKIFGLYGASCIGMIMNSLGVLMVYPFPPIPKKIFIVVFGFSLIGGGDAIIFIPGLIALSKNVKRIEKNIDNLTANDISSAINNLTFALGDFIGPIIGGYLSTHISFKYCCLVLSIFICIYCILFFVYFYKYIIIHIHKYEDNLLDINSNSEKLEEKELMSHPGLYKTNEIETSVFSSRFQALGGRRHSFSGLRKVSEEVEYQYYFLSDEENDEDTNSFN